MLLDNENNIIEDHEIISSTDFFRVRYIGVYLLLIVLFLIGILCFHPSHLLFCFAIFGVFSSFFFLSYSSKINFFSRNKIILYKSGPVFILKKKVIKNFTLYFDDDWICIKDHSNIPLLYFKKKENKDICDWVFSSSEIKHEKLPQSVSTSVWYNLTSILISGFLFFLVLFIIA